MSWHGPSLCADSSVTLGDPVKFISAVSPSQLAGFPPSAFPPSSRWFWSPVATRETEFITNSFCKFLIPHRGTCGSDKTLYTSNSSLGGLSPQTRVCDNDVSLFLCGRERGSVFLFFYFNCSWVKSSEVSLAVNISTTKRLRSRKYLNRVYS